MFENIDALTDAQAEQLHALYQHEWWSRGRTLAAVKAMLHASDHVFGICDDRAGRLVAFARALSDRVYRAFVYDVIVDAGYRGLGLGALLVERIVSHPDLAKIESIQLSCLPALTPFYVKFGFAQAAGTHAASAAWRSRRRASRCR